MIKNHCDRIIRKIINYILALDALKQSLSGNEKTVILDKDSELARILMG